MGWISFRSEHFLTRQEFRQRHEMGRWFLKEWKEKIWEGGKVKIQVSFIEDKVSAATKQRTGVKKRVIKAKKP
jgi:hypothetical protein